MTTLKNKHIRGPGPKQNTNPTTIKIEVEPRYITIRKPGALTLVEISALREAQRSSTGGKPFLLKQSDIESLGQKKLHLLRGASFIIVSDEESAIA